MTKPAVDRVIAELRAGTHDSRLQEVAEALAARILSGHVDQRWTITCQGETWNRSTATYGELRAAEAYAGKPLTDFDLQNSVSDRYSLIAAHYRHQGMDADKVAEVVGNLTEADVVCDIELVEQPVPKDG